MKTINALMISCALAVSTLAHADGHVGDLIAEAEAQYAVALEKKYAWRDTGKMIDQAKKALAAGDAAKAESIAAAALEQAKDAIVQADYNEANWQKNLPF
jgi:hypothetical protein